MREELIEMKREVQELQEQSFAYEILKDYKRQNKVKDIIIFVLLGIITLFIAGLIYVVTNYDFSYEETELSGDGINNLNTTITGYVNNGN